MRSLTTFIFVGAAAVVKANPSNPCLNDEDVFFPDPKGVVKLRGLTLGEIIQRYPCRLQFVLRVRRWQGGGAHEVSRWTFLGQRPSDLRLER